MRPRTGSENTVIGSGARLIEVGAAGSGCPPGRGSPPRSQFHSVLRLRRRGHFVLAADVRVGGGDRTHTHGSNNSLEVSDTMKCFALIALLLLPAAGAAQQEPEQLESRKSAFAAFTLELAVPMAGHIYVGRPARGLLPASLFVGGAGLIVWGADLSTEGGDSPAGLAGLFPILGGVVFMGIGKVWGVTSATRAAVQHNRRLSPSLEVTTDGRLSVGVKMRTR